MDKTTILAILVVIALIVGGVGIMTPYANDGKDGLDGTDGQDGEDGTNGADGLSAYDQWIEYMIGQNSSYNASNFSMSMFFDYLKGEQGERGLRGYTGSTGSRGPQGIAGEDGKDLEPNDGPIIVTNTSMSYVEGCHWNDDFQFKINVTVTDPEEDLMHINIYWKMSPTGNWNGPCRQMPMVTNNTTYTFTKEITGNGYCGDKTMYWLVEVMDGENLVYALDECTLHKCLCP